MERHRYNNTYMFILCILISLGLVSFVSCIIAETTKAKKKDLKTNGRLCYLPASHSFGLGIAALTCLSIAQILGNFIICSTLCSRENTNNSKSKTPKIATILLLFSWISFGIVIILVGAATSMSREQTFEEGWMDQKCYLVKDGVYIGSGVLVLVTIASIVGAAILAIRKTQVEKDRKVHDEIQS